MKGIVFTEFLEMVENEFGLEVVQTIIDECDLDTGGVYTSVGTYSHEDMFKMVAKLSEIKTIPVAQLLEVYGTYFFNVLSRGYPQFMNKPNVFEFLVSIDNYIHPEVLKLYPDAELPSFSSEVKNESEMSLIYTSSRKMADFGIGLIKGAAVYFDEKLEVRKGKEEDNGETVLIDIKRIG